MVGRVAEKAMLTMFVIEADDMHHLMDDGRIFHAAIVEGKNLHSRGSPDLREASLK